MTLEDATLRTGSFSAIISQSTSIADASLVGLTFSDSTPSDLSELLSIDSLDNVWVDQSLFDAYSNEFALFDAIDGNTVTVVEVVPEPHVRLLLWLGQTPSRNETQLLCGRQTVSPRSSRSRAIGVACADA